MRIGRQKMNLQKINDFTDKSVYPYYEYCYVVTSYDLGHISDYIAPNGWTYKNGYPSMESSFSNMVCSSPVSPEFNVT